MINLITCVSYGGTGSSVITDLLKEFEEIDSKGDFEFSFLYEPDGLRDLNYYVVEDFQRLKADEGIYRFEKLFRRMMKEGYGNFISNTDGDKLLNDYINSLVTVEWEGYWHAHSNRNTTIVGKLEKKMNNLKLRFFRQFYSKIDRKYLEYAPDFKKSRMILSNLSQEEFIEKTKDFTDKFLELLSSNIKTIALDQIIPANNIERYMSYFNNIKVIVVDRDPRDLYVLNKYFWNEGWIPTQNIDTYIKWFKTIRCDKSFNSNILRVRFEDLVENYDASIEEILKFLNIDAKLHIRKKEVFNPDKSKANMHLWRKYIEQEELEIRKIENELQEYCYNIERV